MYKYDNVKTKYEFQIQKLNKSKLFLHKVIFISH